VTAVAETPPATRPQLTKLKLSFDEAGVDPKDRDRRLALCEAFAGRPLTSSAELSKAQAHRLIDWLENDPLAVDKLAARLPVGAEVTAAPAPTGNGRGDDLDAMPPVTAPAPSYEPVAPAGDGDIQPSAEAGWTPIRRGPGCWPDGLHWVPPGEGTRYCRCTTVTAMPRRIGGCLVVCYCGACAHYVPAAEPNWHAARAGVREKDRRDLERRTRPKGRW